MRKLQLLSSQVKDNILTHLPTLKEATRSADHLHKYSSKFEALHGEFLRRFQNSWEGNAHGFFSLQLQCGQCTKRCSDGAHWPAVWPTSGRWIHLCMWTDIFSDEVQQIQTQILFHWWAPLSCPSPPQTFSQISMPLFKPRADWIIRTEEVKWGGKHNKLLFVVLQYFYKRVKLFVVFPCLWNCRS